jgi:Reverse transcriptase (RNA-dependent DNA polymerase)
LSTLHKWHTPQRDYVLKFPKAPVEKELYIQLASGFSVKDKDSKQWALKLHQNLYGQKQAGQAWNKYLMDKLFKKLGFKQSQVDQCLFYW